MKASGPKHERETIILFDEESDNATVWTASQVVYRRLKKRLPKFLKEDGERHAIWHIPKDYVVLPRKKRQTSPGGGNTLGLERYRAGIKANR